MDRLVIHICGDYILKMAYTVGAVMDLYPLYADLPDVKVVGKFGNEYMRPAQLIDALQAPESTGIDATIRTACILAEHGMLRGQYYGFGSDTVPSILEILKVTKTTENFLALKGAILTAITEGSRRDIKEEGTDIFAAELNAKESALKRERPTIAKYYTAGKLAGLTAIETYTEFVGVIADIIEIQPKRKEKSKDI